ncbi:MAG: hypothetical protein ACYTBJ_03600 [Planctomycetota bacterium]|jgi:hypothetical protein
MDISKIKELVRAILKGYSSLLIPLAIGLAGVLLLIPTKLMSSKLVKAMETESIAKRGRHVDMLTRDIVVADQWKEEASYQDVLIDDANQVEELLNQTTQREPLSYVMFPEPKDTSMLIFKRFGQQFREAIDDLLEHLNARDCPTEVELKRSVELASSSSGSGRGYLKKEVDATIRNALCEEKAQSASVYTNAADLGGYEFWGEFEYGTAESGDAAIRDCWYAQLGYWIIEDVIAAIEAINSGSNSVFKSRVKRLLSVSFVKPYRSWSARGASGRREEVDLPAYVLAPEDGIVGPCTRRICSDETDDGVDVVHFKVGLIVCTKQILPFMKELCSAREHRFAGWDGQGTSSVFKHNQITILEYKVSPVKRDDKVHDLYRYGTDDVAQLDLVCEYVFYRPAYDEVKPEAVKQSVQERIKKMREEKAKRMPRRASRPTRGQKTGKTKSNKGSRRALPGGDWD